MNTKQCLICKRTYTYKSKIQKYCSAACNVKSYRLRNPETVKKSKLEYGIKNKDKIHKNIINWRDNNKDKMWEYRQARKEKDRVYWKNRRANDLDFKLKNNLRNRLNSAIKNNQRVGSAVKDLGCSMGEFKEYMQSKFQNGMSWDNHGEWHIDHIKPLASFNLSDKVELKKACHYTNLQPLWAKDNLKKWSKSNV